MDPQEPNIPSAEFKEAEIPKASKVKEFGPITTLSVAIFILLTLGTVVFLYYQNQQLKGMLAKYQTPITPSSPTPTATTDPTANWNTYANTKVGFQIKYPLSGFSKPQLPSGAAGSPEVYADENTDNNDILFGNGLPSLEVFDYSGNLDQFISYYTAGKAPVFGPAAGGNVVSTTDLTVDGVPAKKQKTQPKIVYPETKDDVSTFIYFVGYGHGFVFNGGTPDSDQILSTFKFINIIAASPTPKASPVITLPYLIPTGWQIAQDSGSYFQVGYNPSNLKSIPQTVEKDILLGYIKNPGSIDISLKTYSGESMRQFIYNQLGYNTGNVVQEKTSEYAEKEYLVDGKTCLVIYGLQYSASGTTWGMCAMSANQAIFFAGLPVEADNEQFIQTFKLLK